MRKTLTLFTRTLLGSAVLWPALASAQPMQAMGTVRGTVYDSLTRRPLANAVVEVQETARLTYTDAQGRFSLDSVPVGAQQLTFSSTTLDSLGLYGFARTIEVRTDTRGVVLATPSFRTVYARLCPATDSPPTDSAIVFGTVYDAADRAPINGAQVVLRWFETDAKTRGLQLRTPQRTASTGADGVYGICGVPADLALSTSASHDSAASGVFSTVVGPGRILRRDFYLSRELGNLASSANAASVQGTGRIRGTVRDERGNALVGALVVLTTIDRTTNTDSAGRYHFANVPLGTQELSVRQLGRGALYRIIDVTAREEGAHDFVLPTTTVLATMNVRREASVGADQAGFLRRKNQGFIKVVEREEILKRFDVGSALKRVSGLRVTQQMGTTQVTSTRPFCAGEVPIIIDGVPISSHGNASLFSSTQSVTPPQGDGKGGGSNGPQITMAPPSNTSRIDQLAVNDVIAIEFHAGPATVPMEYWSGPPPQCGLILIWTVFARWR